MRYLQQVKQSIRSQRFFSLSRRKKRPVVDRSGGFLLLGHVSSQNLVVDGANLLESSQHGVEKVVWIDLHLSKVTDGGKVL